MLSDKKDMQPEQSKIIIAWTKECANMLLKDENKKKGKMKENFEELGHAQMDGIFQEYVFPKEYLTASKIFSFVPIKHTQFRKGIIIIIAIKHHNKKRNKN